MRPPQLREQHDHRAQQDRRGRTGRRPVDPAGPPRDRAAERHQRADGEAPRTDRGDEPGRALQSIDPGQSQEGGGRGESWPPGRGAHGVRPRSRDLAPQLPGDDQRGERGQRQDVGRRPCPAPARRRRAPPRAPPRHRRPCAPPDRDACGRRGPDRSRAARSRAGSRRRRSSGRTRAARCARCRRSSARRPRAAGCRPSNPHRHDAGRPAPRATRRPPRPPTRGAPSATTGSTARPAAVRPASITSSGRITPTGPLTRNASPSKTPVHTGREDVRASPPSPCPARSRQTRARPATRRACPRDR